MSGYQDSLKLDHDPFAPATRSRSFFGGAGREALLHRLVEQAHYGAPLSAVCGALGAGKTSLAREFSNAFSDEAVVVQVQATLFMNKLQFLEALLQQLPIGASSPEPQDIIADICQFAERLFLDAKTLVVVVDDAHELASEVLESIGLIVARVSESALHVLLLGETQLSGMLHSVLGADLLARLLEEELKPLGGESAMEYVVHKLKDAGYEGPVPLDPAQLGVIVNEASGNPGVMNTLISTSLNDASMRPPKVRTGGAPVDSSKPLSFSSAAFASLAPGAAYWIAALVLFGLLLGALLLPEGASNDMDVAMATQEPTTATTQRIELSVPVQNDSFSTVVQPQSTVASALTESPDQAAVRLSEETAVADSGSEETTDVLLPPIEHAAPDDQPRSEEPELAAAEVSEGVQVSDFEQQLLAYPSEHYTVQIMGSRSEDSVRRFVARELGALNHGYFETRYQDQPWFVVVMGNFVSREAASRAVSDLPASIRELDPWVRNLTDIQSDIRTVRGLN
ncbi:MAG: AAA family ATPase [Pseudomonadales bacterium]|nr:AAA family ATPase [Pseudomonadales bacterium]